ncbi:FtsX-like permease family protein [Bifidobacterium saeculare]|nr:ABC transporter permease [Bifidobacterium pullorum]MBE5065353.1 FtsX-like permease family protein [Bifidobacterium pullorum subsp. saeculare]
MGVKRLVKHSRHSVKHAVKQNVVAADFGDFASAPRGRNHRPRGGAIALAYVRDTLRSWLHSWKRFLSIAVICLLGVSVLTGIYAGCRDMFMAADRFYDEQGLHDIQVLSTYGLTDDDVMALRRIDGVDVVQPDRTQSATTDVGGTDKSVTMTEIGVAGLDQPYLQEGRMPAKAGEVAVTEKFLIDSGHDIGDTITITPVETTTTFGVDLSESEDSDNADTDKDAETSPEFPTELTITAQVLDPKDLTNPTGYATSALRSPTTADYVFFAPSDGVTGNVYTAISLSVEGAAEQDTFGDDYDRIVGDVVARIERTVQDDRQQARRQSIVNDAQDQLNDAKADVYAQLDDAQQQIDDQRATLDENRQTLADTRSQLEAAQAELDEQRAKADEEFAKQQQTIDDIADVRWYVQDRSSVGGYSSLDSDVSSIETLGYAFPVVFLLVAVLMSLTSMTRMVEEERGLIGTYTGLGYGSLTIASRYLLFAALACLIGGALGLLVGFLGIPAFLLTVLENMYVIPGIVLEYDWLYGSLGIALFVVAVLTATGAACLGELRQTPAQLMRPKAPKAGSRVLLERIKPVWRRLSFLNKVTVRNIFRFKSRLIMTVGGVAGCTALIVCGFAINDSVDTLGPKQYEDLYRYDLLVAANDDNADAMADLLTGDADVTDTMRVRLESGEIATDEGSATIQLMVIPDGGGDDLAGMVDLQDVEHGRRELTLEDDAVIVSKSAANALGVKSGDTVSLTDGNMQHGEVTVTAVNRSVIGSDVYIGESAYRQAFDDDAPMTWNAVYAHYEGSGDEQVEYAEELQDDPVVLTAMSCEDMRRSFRFELMAAVVALIIGLAGGLALVVLFTLANTNVSERVREMATLKVLGFTDREVHTYVNKEMMILTGVGIVAGLPLGRFIGGLLTAALNMPSIYFEVEVHWWSYLIAAVITLVFALLVQLITNPVLDRIDPVSSLKSVE